MDIALTIIGLFIGLLCTRFFTKRHSRSNWCNCSDWQKNIRQVDHIFSFAMSHGVMYTGKKAQYCLWCGGRLNESGYG